ncbi:MAG TPA: methyl-accepting chemotaxis protein [Gemmatimonadales bacterium]|nr:methyl-accepting chemotaxis protein [Gemmatimonadales bacterium]
MSTRFQQQLRSSFLFTGVAGAAALAVAVALAGGQNARQTLERLANERDRAVATNVAALVTNYWRERRHETDELARRLSTRAGIVPDAALGAFLRDYVQHSDLADLLVVDGRGDPAAGSAPLERRAYRADAWWQVVLRDGSVEGTGDSSSRALYYAVALRQPGLARPVGVLRATLPLSALVRLLASSAADDAVYLCVIDRAGRLLATPDTSALLHSIPDAEAIPRDTRAVNVLWRRGGATELVVSAPANEGRWWVLYRQPTALAYAAVRTTLRTIALGAIAVLVLVLLLVWRLAAWLTDRVTEPVRAAGAVATRIAGGDLSATVLAQGAGTGEVGELLSAVHTMVVALRRLVGAIRSAADEAAAMAAEISASTEQMSASTEEMSATCQDLSRRAAEQAQLIRGAAGDTTKILEIITIVAAGSEDSVRRNATVATLARQNREVLDQSTAQLAHLAEEVARGAAEADALAAASAEIQKFVTQAKAVATQTNMLALNAAIEAARAGPQGRGFAVVADEVRKLAAVAAAAAGDTAEMVRTVLTRVQATRERLLALAKVGAAAREAAQTAAQGLATVATEAAANDAWSREIAASTAEVRSLVDEITGRLGSVALGTEGLLAAAQEIAASSEEQSASTEEIAASANQLAEAADRLSGAVKSFRLLGDEAAPVQTAAD